MTIKDDVIENMRPETMQSCVHATAVILGAGGVLLRGASGAGKSAMAEALVANASQRGWFARLVCDDRVRLARMHDRILLNAHPAISGQIERRCLGIATVAHEPSVVLRLVVDLYNGERGAMNEPPRYPSLGENWTDIMGLAIARMTARPEAPALPIAIFAFLAKSGV